MACGRIRVHMRSCHAAMHKCFLLKNAVCYGACSYLFRRLCSSPIFCRTDSSIFKCLYNIKVKGVNRLHTKFYLIWSKISGTLRASKITTFLNFSVKLHYCWYLGLVVTSQKGKNQKNMKYFNGKFVLIFSHYLNFSCFKWDETWYVAS